MPSPVLSRRDLDFLLYDWLDVESLTARSRFAEHSRETFDAVLDLSADIATKHFATHNKKGDAQEPRIGEDGRVEIIPEVKDALDLFCKAGLLAGGFDEKHGGMQLPVTVQRASMAWFQAANAGTSAYPFLTAANASLLVTHGSDEQIGTFVPPMLEGRFFGTMCLSEPQAGSSLADITTRAVPAADGTYRLTGTKMWISGGDHELTENIVHLVLARTPGAPEGTKGISLFVVPKFIPDADGNLGERNSLKCLSIEHKIGIHGSPTCVMSYEGAKGWLVGEEHKGMRAMFVMMNVARLSVGMQGLSQSVRAYQQSLEYAKDRVQGRTVTGEKTIIGHPDVRRMLMMQKSNITALRYLLMLNAVQIDLAHHHPDEQVRARAEEMAGLLTPLCKSWGTDAGLENTSLNIQIHGGSGYIEETGAAQFWRDIRIALIYEGTNGVQAADLVARKMPVRQGQSFLEFISEMGETVPALTAAGEDFAPLASGLERALGTLGKVTGWMLQTGASGDVASVLAGSEPYQRLWALTVGAWLLAKAALHEDAPADALGVAKFFYAHQLAEVSALAVAATAGADNVLGVEL